MVKILRNRPINNAFDFDWIHQDCSILNDETKEFDFANHKVALGGFDEEVVVVKYLKGFLDAIEVNPSIIVSCNEHIVHIDEEPSVRELMNK